jgi:GNAT superfamily N-acetyltransferase
VTGLAGLLEVTPGSRALDLFLKLPEEVYRGDPGHDATPRRQVVAGLFRPDFAGRQRAWVMEEGGRPAARLVARISPSLRDASGRPYGMIGFFEALEGVDVAGLFAAAVAWLREAGAGEIVGPLDGDTWHKHRLNVGPYDDPPFLLEPYNPPWYPAVWEARGFEVLERYASTRVDTAAVVAGLEGKHRTAAEAGYRLRRLDPSRFREELGRIYRMSRALFAGNFLYTEIPEEEFLSLYAGAKSLLDPELVWFAEAPDGADAGFLFAFPDRFRAVAAMRGKRGPLAMLRFLRHRNEAEAVNFKTLGVMPGHRRAGLASALMWQGHRIALDKGYRAANHCLFREGNPSGGLDAGSGRVMRRYHLYRLAGLARETP